MDSTAPRYGLDPYLDWIAQEGTQIVTAGFAENLLTTPVKAWPRFGVDGAAVHLTGRGDFCSVFLFELKPGGSSAPSRHLYEEMFYVLEGAGSAQVEFPDGTKRSFEWGPKAMFSIPINVAYRFFNSSGRQRARLACVNNMPLLMNLFHNERFIFNSDFEFGERSGKEGYFSGEGDFIPIRPGNHLWETNFVPDLADLEVYAYADRGGGGGNVKFVLADGVMSGHMSEMPAGTYKKAHRHGAGTHVFTVTGHGYTLLWFEGDREFERVDWKHGYVFPPLNGQIHQHFNMSPEPSRYLAIGFGNVRYPFTSQKRNTMIGAAGDKRQRSSLGIKDGGQQIEYVDQDPRIHALWLKEIAQAGVEPRMEKYIAA